MTKQMKAEIVWNSFCEITEHGRNRERFSCNELSLAENFNYDAETSIRTKYEKLFKPNLGEDDAWLFGQFKTEKEKHEWRMNALLLFREMILTGDV